MSDPRLKGQEISIRVVTDSVVDNTIDSIASMNDEVMLELKEAGFLGELVNRFDEIFNGFGGDMEIQLTKANWVSLELSIIERAQRKVLSRIFNVIRTDLYGNGDSSIYTYADVKWGAIATTIASRADYVKVKMQFKCSERTVQTNALP
jgi:hypothetical protein